MKKNVLYLAAGLLALASCSQDETTGTDNGGSIRFRPVVGNVTRGPVITTDNITAFKVSSYVTGAVANFFTDLQVNKTGSSWNTAQVYYWPGTGTLNFFAYAPVDVTTVTVSPTARAINNFSPAAKVAEQKDVVVAFATGTKAANENSGVPLTFKHALSQIEVKAKSANTTAYEIKVLGVKLGHISSTANFTFPTTVVTGTLPASHWTAPATAKDYGTNLDADLTLTSEVQSITKSNFLMIPQQLTPWTKGTSADGAYIAVLCKICSKNGTNLTQIFPGAADKFAYAAVPISTNWLPGKKYTYTLSFLGNNGAGNIDPNPTDPTDPENPNNPNVDPNPGQGGDSVLGGPIKFTVTVDDWDNLPEENMPL